MVKSVPSEKFAKKTKMVAWFCSNTVTHGKREDYFKELGKHVLTLMHSYWTATSFTFQPKTLSVLTT